MSVQVAFVYSESTRSNLDQLIEKRGV